MPVLTVRNAVLTILKILIIAIAFDISNHAGYIAILWAIHSIIHTNRRIDWTKNVIHKIDTIHNRIFHK